VLHQLQPPPQDLDKLQNLTTQAMETGRISSLKDISFHKIRGWTCSCYFGDRLRFVQLKTPVPSANLSSFASMKPAFAPLSLLRAAWKQKLVGALVAIGVAVMGIIVTYRLPAVYMADALILVDPQKIPEKFVASTVNTDVQDRLATISQEIQSSTRLKKI